VYLLTASGQLVAVTSDAPATATATLSITGLSAGDTLLAIDLRAQNSSLYGLARSSTGGVQLYTISTVNGAATPVGTAGALVDAGGNAIAVPATATVDMDFNPAADRLRVVTDTGLNFRLNANTGAILDGDLGGAAGSIAGLNPDGTINGGSTTVAGTAYTNNQLNTTVTTQYTLDPAGDQLFIQTPPNSGTQTGAKAFKLNGAAVDVSAVAGFDIAKGVNVSVSNTAVTGGEGFAALTVGGAQGLYRVNLADGSLTALGGFGGIGAVRSLAMNTPTPGGFALDNAGAQLSRFALETPGTAAGVAVSGVTVGETLVALDLRSSTRGLYALGVNATANTGTLYLLDPQTGAASAVGLPGQVTFTSDGVAAVDLPDPSTTGYDIDFNPMADRVRVITASGLNFRVNPTTGGPVDGNTGALGTNPDAALNGASTTSSGTGYTNSYAGATVTTMYALDATTNQLLIQNPPNAGTLTVPVAVTLGGTALDFADLVGFDIASSVQVSVANAVATGEGYAALSVAGSGGLYRVNLTSGAATLVGNFSGAVRSLAIHP
jgi:hypothetical protein